MDFGLLLTRLTGGLSQSDASLLALRVSLPVFLVPTNISFYIYRNDRLATSLVSELKCENHRVSARESVHFDSAKFTDHKVLSSSMGQLTFKGSALSWFSTIYVVSVPSHMSPAACVGQQSQAHVLILGQRDKCGPKILINLER